MKWFQRKSTIPSLPHLPPAHYSLHELLYDLVDLWEHEGFWKDSQLGERMRIYLEVDGMDSASIAELKGILYRLTTVVDELTE